MLHIGKWLPKANFDRNFKEDERKMSIGPSVSGDASFITVNETKLFSKDILVLAR